MNNGKIFICKDVCDWFCFVFWWVIFINMLFNGININEI